MRLKFRVKQAGHRRFTSPNKLPPLVHQIANILEDEKIERQMCQEFAGVRWLVKRLSHQLYKESKPIDEKSDSPGEEIVRILALKELEIPEWVKDILDKLGSIEGERTEGDAAEKVRGGIYHEES